MATCNSTALAFWQEADKTQWWATNVDYEQVYNNHFGITATKIVPEQVTSPAVYEFKEFVSANTLMLTPDDSLLSFVGNSTLTIASNITTAEPTLIFYKDGKEHVQVDKEGVVTGKFNEIDVSANYFYSSIINLGIRYQALQDEHDQLKQLHKNELEVIRSLLDTIKKQAQTIHLLQGGELPKDGSLSNAIDRINVNGMHAPTLSIVENS